MGPHSCAICRPITGQSVLMVSVPGTTDLNSRSSCANHRASLASDIDALGWPEGRMVHRAFELVEAGEIRNVAFSRDCELCSAE